MHVKICNVINQKSLFGPMHFVDIKQFENQNYNAWVLCDGRVNIHVVKVLPTGPTDLSTDHTTKEICVIVQILIS